MNPTPIRILIADDHLVVRLGLRGLIKDEPDLELVAEASSGLEAIDLFRKHRPDVVLMDLRMQAMNGLEATGAILREFPQACVVVLTAFGNDEDLYRAFRAGARAYLLKDGPREEFLRTLRAAHSGQYCVPSEVGTRLMRRLPEPELSARELEVLRGIVEGRINKEIAATLSITESTVKNHVNSILAKLRVQDRTQAATTALRRGLLTLD